MLHDLHFVITKKDFELILEKTKEVDECFSGVVRIMIFYMMPFIDLNWLKSKSRKSRYKVLDRNPKERFHIHCYVSEEIYQKFKTVHKDLDFYSMSQIVRLVVKYFLHGVRKYGYDGFIERLQNCKKKWNKKLKKFADKKITFGKQMRKGSLKFNYFQTVYSTEYEPIMIKFMNFKNSS
jgi:hypothetical protein